MSVYNSIKNIFFVTVFLFLFLISGVVNAGQNYASTNADKLKSAGWTDQQIADFDSNYEWLSSGVSGSGLYSNVNLYIDKGEQERNLSRSEIDVLGSKLISANSFNQIAYIPTNLFGERGVLTLKEGVEDDVYVVNTGNTSSYFLKKPDGSTVLLATATKEGDFLVAMKDTPKELTSGGGPTAKGSSHDALLNAIDVTKERPAGTSLEIKNRSTNLENEADRLKQEKVDLEQQKKQEEDIVNDPLIDKALRDAAQKRLNEINEKLGIVNNNIASNSEAQDIENLRQAQNIQNAGVCSVTTFYTPECILTVVSYITNLVFKLVSFTTYVVGKLFDYSLEISINSAQLIKQLGVVEVTWSFIRDVLNMTFIFILLWTAIQILLFGNEGNYNARKILTRVILVAILMNFSLFAAKLMVDTSNIISLKIYEAMKATDSTQQGSSISMRVMNTVGLTALYNFKEIFSTNTYQASSLCVGNPGALITISIMGSIFLLIICLALGLAAILFLIRLVNIIFLFIKSPLWVWSYVLPGNSRMEKIKKEWQNEMQHVLTFPIMYLLWMLVGVIIFESLGKTRDNGTSFLDIICYRGLRNETFSSGAVGDVISLVAIFGIVIIIMMKAVEYGIKHSGDGGGWGGDLGKKAADKIGGYQTALTKGLAKKAGAVTVGAGAATVGGTLKFGGRVGGALSGLASVGANGDTLKERVAQGFLNPGTYTKERFANITGKAALLTGSKTLAEKALSLKESAEKSRKSIYEERVKSDKEKEEALQKVAKQQYKIDTQEEWEKKNGKIGTDADKLSAYEKYITEQITKQADARLGKGIINRNNKGGIRHIDEIKNKAVSRDEIKDGSGNVVGWKIKVNNHSVASGFEDAFKYHTTGKGADVQKIDKKGIWKPFRTKKAEARVKAAEKSLREDISNASSEKAEKDLNDIIKKTEEKLAHMPDDATLDDTLNTGNKITTPAQNYSEIKKLNKMLDKQSNIKRRLRTAASVATKTQLQNELDDLEDKIYDHVENIKKTRNSDSEKLVKKKEELKKKEEQKNK